MKRQFSTLIFGALLLAGTLNAQDAGLPSAESIMDRFVEVTGGPDAHAGRTAEYYVGTMSMAGIVGTLEGYFKPGMQYLKIELPQIGLIESGLKDGVAWEASSIGGARIKTGGERDLSIVQADPMAAVNWREMYAGVEVTGKETVDGEEAYVVLQTPAEGTPTTAYYSVDSGLLLRTSSVVETPFGQIPIQATMLNYQKVGDVLMSLSQTVNQAGQIITISVDSIEADAEFSDEVFDYPEAVQALL